MHKFLSAVGFHECYTKRQLDDILKDVLSNPDEEVEVTDSLNRRIFQARKNYANNMGISIIGEIDQRGFHNVLFSFPYLIGNEITQEDEIQLQKYAEKDAYAGISEDYNIGVSLIFSLINLTPIIKQQKEQLNIQYSKVYLSALSTEGKVIFGVEKNDEQLKLENDCQISRNNLIQEAKNGDMDAIESLTLEDIDLYTVISKRASKEDIYSIVDTTFMPYGVESDQYSILGNIESIKEEYNNMTNDKIYVIDVQCNNINITVAINERDIIGEPKVGRRFKGVIWLQGLLVLEN